MTLKRTRKRLPAPRSPNPSISVVLREWETMEPIPGSALNRYFLPQDAAIQELAARLTQSGKIGLVELKSGLKVQASSHVGRIDLGDLRVTVVPKLDEARMLSLMRYAYGLRHLEIHRTAQFGKEQWNFQDLIVAQLISEAKELVSRGLHRRYEARNELLTSPRGRINVQAVARAGAFLNAGLPCVHHPRLEDCLANQVLLAGLQMASKVTTDSHLKSGTRRLSKFLALSVSIIRLDRESLNQLRRERNRLTRRYDPAFALIEMLLESEGIALDDNVGGPRLPGFLFDMNRFFQALLSRFLNENLPDCQIRDEFRLKGMMSYLPNFNPRNRRSPQPRPDYVVARDMSILSVLDAKYRDLWERPLPREMLYQLAVYALGQRSQTGSAMLYPTTHPDARESKILIRDALAGGRQAIVSQRPVDLHYLNELVRRDDHDALRSRSEYAWKLVAGE